MGNEPRAPGAASRNSGIVIALERVAAATALRTGSSDAGKPEAGVQPLPRWFWIIIAAVATCGAATANPILTPAAILIVAAVIQIVWRHGEPPVLAFACGMQWVQASAVIFYADFCRLSVAEAGGAAEFETATWLSLIAVFVLSLGMKTALINCSESQHERLRAEALRVHVGKAFVTYGVMFIIAAIAERVAFSAPSIRQLIVPLTTLKWMAVFVVAYCVMEQRAGYGFVITIACVELAVGVSAFFGGFKDVFFVLIVAALASPLALKGRRLALTIGMIILLFVFGVVWSAIKADYRDFLNQGTGQQEVLVSIDESAVKLTNLVGNVTWQSFSDGIDTMILRLGYTKYFALTLMNVPDAVPYEHGALWLGTLKHVVTPRLLFPEKAGISDSERTTLYTGLEVAGEEQGTSISIGYVCESYVDFGPILMFAPIFLVGVAYGLIYRVFIITSRSKLLCTAIATSILVFNGYKMETSNIKIVGQTVTALLVVSLTYLIFGRALRAWLKIGSS